MEEIGKWFHPDAELVKYKRTVEMTKQLNLRDHVEPPGTHGNYLTDGESSNDV